MRFWEFIAEDSLDAADRVIAEILAACEQLAPFRTKDTFDPT